MFKGIRFFIREGWKYDKLYILWRIMGSLLSALMPVAAALMPKYIIDELMGAQRPGTLITYVALFAGYAYLAGATNSFFSMDGFTRRCNVGKEFDMRLNRKLIEADYADIETPSFRDMKQKAEKFLYCDWHGFGYLLDCAVQIIGQSVTLIGLIGADKTCYDLAIAFTA